MRGTFGELFKDLFFGVGSIAMIIAIPAGLFIAWLTHIIHTIQNEEFIFLVAGAIFFPIAIIHGIGLWFGIF